MAEDAAGNWERDGARVTRGPDGKWHVFRWKNPASGTGRWLRSPISKRPRLALTAARVAIRCSPFHTASAFHPIIEHLKRVFGWQSEDTAQQHLAKLEAGLAGFKTLPRSESVRLFADLISVPAPEDRYPRLAMTAQQQREATLDAIVA